MAHIHDLIKQLRISNPALGDEIAREVEVLSQRRAFGLNFERHTPEAVELPGRRVRRGDKVRILPPRGDLKAAADKRVWRVDELSQDKTEARLVIDQPSVEYSKVALDDLVVVAEFRDPIYPGLVPTGKVERGGDKPFHSVINAENYHALQALLYTHRGKVDAIYIDPPYNTGARDWKYNNDYVEGDDMYRHSKWLAFMERRLLLAKELLNPDDSVLIVTIDEKEYLRLGMLLTDVFSDARIQMVSIVINGQGSARKLGMSRVDEYAFFVYIGEAGPTPAPLETLQSDDGQSQVGSERIWFPLIRGGKSGLRAKSNESFFPIYVDDESGRIVEVGVPLPADKHPIDAPAGPSGSVAVWPISKEGIEGRWQMARAEFTSRLANGYIRVGAKDRNGKWPITYVRSGTIDRIVSGQLLVEGVDANGALVLAHDPSNPRGRTPKTVWYLKSHNAGTYGTDLLGGFVAGREFPFPKSLYAVEDALRFFVASKPDATIVDFFSGSGTTAHAVMRLNKQDGGRRRSISITNNEVSADEQKKLRAAGLRPGDPEWEQWGICDYITKPRIQAAITGRTPNGDPIKGDYKFTDEFPMADGFDENVEFFTLTYESPMRVQSHREFARIAPLLWLRAGSQGRRIEALPDGWDVAEAYGVIDDIDKTDAFVAAMMANPEARIAFIVTDEDRFFEAIANALPEEVEVVRLYDSYLRNFEIDAMRGVR